MHAPCLTVTPTLSVTWRHTPYPLKPRWRQGGDPGGDSVKVASLSNQPATRILKTGDRPVAIEFSKFALRVASGPDKGNEIDVERRSVRVGTSPACDLVLSDSAVSRVHCEIQIGEGGYLLRDRDSTNGTWVSGMRVEGIYLTPGAAFEVGDTTIEFAPSEKRVEIRLSEQDHFGNVLGRSVPMRSIFYLLERVASKSVTVLLTGETGTGKEVFAQAVHDNSPRKDEPLITVDCGSLAPTLIGSELFGHAKGAFTGANSDRAGAFEDASGGTVFLDEIGELPAEQQTALLRVLEAGEIKRLGENSARQVDVRIIAATNRNLAEEVEAGRFRKDLFFRLNVLNVEIPPLRDRREDIELLANHFLESLAEKSGQESPTALDPAALSILQSHTWPGNVRELRNVLERAHALADDDKIDAASIMLGSQPLDPGDSSSPSEFPIEVNVPYADAKEALEKVYLVELLRQNDANVSQAARVIGIHRQSLHRLLRKHGIKSKEVL